MWLRYPADWSGACLAVSLALTLIACFPIGLPMQRQVFSHRVFIDITGSMNVTDYRVGGGTISRLEAVKAALHEALTALPCGSRLGLGVFTGRRPFVLFEPIEVCDGFAAMDAAIGQIDWRMAWEADSRIADSFRNSLDLVRDSQDSLVFITDGQEAPPLNPRYRPELSDYLGKTKGVIIGAGSLALSPIPKFDEQGKSIGQYAQDEVMQRSTFGLPELPPDEVEGYHARNNPFGNMTGGGTEHLSSLREPYLTQLAGEAGLSYRRLEGPRSLVEALTQPDLAGAQMSWFDLRPLMAGLAILAWVLAYLPLPHLIYGRGSRARPFHLNPKKGVQSR